MFFGGGVTFVSSVLFWEDLHGPLKREVSEGSNIQCHAGCQVLSLQAVSQLLVGFKRKGWCFKAVHQKLVFSAVHYKRDSLWPDEGSPSVITRALTQSLTQSIGQLNHGNVNKWLTIMLTTKNTFKNSENT